jgi:proteasome accessory factor C
VSRSAGERLQRVLAMVPWIASQDGPTIDDVCARFGMTRQQVLDDLNVVWLVGLPPYTPDELVDVVIEDDRVWIRYADFFSRPLRLTPEQGLALVAAGTTLQALPGADPDGPLARGLAKLASVLGVEPGGAIEVNLGATRPGVLEALQQAARERRQIRLDYYTYGRDEHSTRTVDPYRVYADEGAWYLLAHCHQAEGERLFRVDRIEALELLDAVFAEPPDRPAGDVFRPAPDDPRIQLELEPAAAWVADYYPMEERKELGDGRLRVTLAVTATPWLERLLVRLGSTARVVGEPEGSDLALAGSRASRRILARYGH